MDFKHFIEAVATGQDIRKPPTVDNDYGDNDDEEWDWWNLYKKYNETVRQWVKNNKTAELVRFNVFSAVMNQKPTIRFDFDVTSIKTPYYNEKAKRQRISEDKKGSVKTSIEWMMPIKNSALWGALIQEQRHILAKSDLYKIFASKFGSAALLFKGDVLEFFVWACCATNSNISWYPNDFKDNKSSGFPEHIIEKMKTKYEIKMNEATKNKIESSFKSDGDLIPVFTRGLATASFEEVVINFHKLYNFTLNAI